MTDHIQTLQTAIRQVLQRMDAQPPAQDTSYYIAEIDDLLTGEDDRQVIDCLLDRRLDLMEERDGK
jgi:hypothetical protein